MALMEKLVEIIQRRLNQHKLGSVSEASQILFDAQTFFHHHFIDDPQLVRPLKIQNAVLWVGVQNASLSQEVRGILPQLMKQLHGRYGERLVKQIRTKSLTDE